MSQKLQIRLISPWTERVETDEAVFSVDISTERADALLCEWAPSPELFTFPRRKAWYCCEPQCQFQRIEGGKWPTIKAQLGPHEFLYHGHPNPYFRVPHITHFEPLIMNHNRDRKESAIAIVSNHGGSPFRRHPDITYRNRLITSPQVELYGRSSWKSYRAAWYSPPRSPKNYKGEISGDWPADQKRASMSQYKVCVCLENMNEPGYFTEKFVEAVVAGCIPVYRATADIRETFLNGACWVDPSDQSASGEKAILSALKANIETFWETNERWLKESRYLSNTHSQAVFKKIGILLATQ
jgi:hypothetical protein